VLAWIYDFELFVTMTFPIPQFKSISNFFRDLTWRRIGKEKFPLFQHHRETLETHLNSADRNKNRSKLYHRTLFALKSSKAVVGIIIPCFIAAFFTRCITLHTWQIDRITKMTLIFISYICHYKGSAFKIKTEWWNSIWWKIINYCRFSR